MPTCSTSSSRRTTRRTLNRQGNDVGTQYRSAIFPHDDAQDARGRGGDRAQRGELARADRHHDRAAGATGIRPRTITRNIGRRRPAKSLLPRGDPAQAAETAQELRRAVEGGERDAPASEISSARLATLWRDAVRRARRRSLIASPMPSFGIGATAISRLVATRRRGAARRTVAPPPRSGRRSPTACRRRGQRRSRSAIRRPPSRGIEAQRLARRIMAGELARAPSIVRPCASAPVSKRRRGAWPSASAASICVAVIGPRARRMRASPNTRARWSIPPLPRRAVVDDQRDAPAEAGDDMRGARRADRAAAHWPTARRAACRTPRAARASRGAPARGSRSCRAPR